jgi:hypothetical protein
MNTNTRFAIASIISFFSLLFVGIYAAHAQDSPLGSSNDRRGTQTSVTVDQTTTLPRGNGTLVPPRGDATQGPPDVHSDTRQRRGPEAARQTRPSGMQDTQPQSSSSLFRDSISDVQSKIRVLPQNQVNTKSNTPCGSPKCLGESLTTQKTVTSQLNGTGKSSGNVVSPKFQGAAGRGRR